MPVIMKNRFSIIKRTRSMRNLEKAYVRNAIFVQRRNSGMHRNIIITSHSRHGNAWQWSFDASLLVLEWLESARAHDRNLNPLYKETKLQHGKKAGIDFDERKIP
jgi:hypothetical protein